ncbi:DegT/DnrJ/EryC1/StrS family aminotransferase [Candidatus Saccharibacteria bacterium]|nr:DegT/DnrJ/EryC1/StrS family aminotransferase [Candidatus Saccharibacteria bacterium]
MNDSKERINVTKTFLPPLEEFEPYLHRIWESGQLTNQGSLVLEFENKVAQYLNLDSTQLVSNGTLALQLALEASDIRDGEIITTPFSYVATTSAIMWQRCTPVYVDIDPQTLCIDADKIEASITSKTKAIMPVHVFGNVCNVEKIEAIAKKHKLKVIYDAAHAFGVQYKDSSILGQGDISICSFHATKLFHTIEGGLIVATDKEIGDKVDLIKRFGHNGDDHRTLGINAKASEFQAAMGLVNLKHIDELIAKRKKAASVYDYLLNTSKVHPVRPRGDIKYNYAYYPVLFNSEASLKKAIEALAKKNIFPRRYFYPSLNKLPYIINAAHCPISEDVSLRIACLPLFADIDKSTIMEVSEVLQ